MRAFTIQEFGKPGSVQMRPIPVPQEGEVLVRVKAAGVNAMDPLIASGAYQAMMEHRLPLTPGLDVAGVIEAVGPGVEGLRVGDEVYGRSTKRYFGDGAFAEFMITTPAGLAPKPTALSHVQASALGTAGTTALALVGAAGVQPGQTVAIVGAAGGVGAFTTQLAAQAGARVIAVTSAAGAALVRDLGATDVVDYEAGEVAGAIRALAPDGVDVLIDLHGDRDALLALSSTVKPGGHVVSPVGAADSDAPEARGLHGGNIRAATDRVGELGEMAARGDLRVPVSRQFPLEQAGEALAAQATHQATGKLVIVVDPEL
ncbi:MAG TPA: NADP-dependent oxidoreductase [Candidatus Sulfotelmatobacter sp.]|nr:NADP-dependent oxidoreductase [Candidatus Sulfotelmatobacter sp.]